MKSPQNESSKTLPISLDAEQVTALLDQPNVKCATGLRNRAILEVMYRAGLRVSEVTNLKPGHIDWVKGQLVVRGGKGGKDRVVPVEAGVMDWLERWEGIRPKANGRFFSTLQGKPLSRVYLWGLVKRCARKTGMDFEKVSPHVLRHTYASQKLEDGFTIAEVQALLGHSNISTTSIYLHANPKALREKIQGRAVKQAKLDAILEQVAALQAEIDQD